MSTITYNTPYKSSFEGLSSDLESLLFAAKFSVSNLLKIKLKLLQSAEEICTKSGFKDFDTVKRTLFCRFATQNPMFEAESRFKLQLVKDNGVNRNITGSDSHLTSVQRTMYSLTILAVRGSTCTPIRGK